MEHYVSDEIIGYIEARTGTTKEDIEACLQIIHALMIQYQVHKIELSWGIPEKYRRSLKSRNNLNS